MTTTYLWHYRDTPVPIRVTFTDRWGGDNPLAIEGFAAADPGLLAEFVAEYTAEPELRELVMMECEREADSWADSYSYARCRAEWNEERQEQRKDDLQERWSMGSYHPLVRPCVRTSRIRLPLRQLERADVSISCLGT